MPTAGCFIWKAGFFIFLLGLFMCCIFHIGAFCLIILLISTFLRYDFSPGAASTNKNVCFGPKLSSKFCRYYCDLENLKLIILTSAVKARSADDLSSLLIPSFDKFCLFLFSVTTFSTAHGRLISTGGGQPEFSSACPSSAWPCLASGEFSFEV